VANGLPQRAHMGCRIGSNEAKHAAQMRIWVSLRSVAPQILQGAGKRTAASESIAVSRTVKDHGVVVNREATADATPGREAK
jgi:hypothetical protein